MEIKRLKVSVSREEVAAIIAGMPLNQVATFTYQSVPTFLLLKDMTEDAQLSALHILRDFRTKKQQ